MNPTDDRNQFILRDGYDRRKHPRHRLYRRMTIEEAKQLCGGEHVSFIANDGTARYVKVNGRVRTWKREPGRVGVPVKYGMYEYAVFCALDAVHMDRLIVEV